MAKTIVNKTSNYTILTEECNGTKIFSNQGATGTIIFTLPTISESLEVNISNLLNNLPVEVAASAPLNWTAPVATLDSTNGTEINLISSGSVWNGTAVQLPRTVSAPTAQSYGLSLNANSVIPTSQMNALWTSGNGYGTLVLIKAATTITDTPVNDVTYTANLTFGSGELIGTSRVIYTGTGTSLTVSGLTANTRYAFRLFAYNIDPVYGPQYNLSTAETYVIRSRFTSL